MQYYFSEKGTPDVGPELKLDSNKILKKESGLRPREYFKANPKYRIAKQDPQSFPFTNLS